MRNLFFVALTLTVLNPISTFATTVIIKPGDTLSAIAEKHNVSLTKLIRTNRIKDSNNLKIGQRIIIPDSNNYKEKQYQNYTVIEGDTLNNIALRFRISKQELMTVNRIENIDYLFEGQVLKVPEIKLLSENSTRNHIILSGETIGGIAQKYNSKEKDIILLNKIQDPNNIFPGQKLLIPNNNKLEKGVSIKSKRVEIKPEYHLIASGDTLFHIAQRYKIPLKTVLEINQFNEPNNLKVGTKVYLNSKFSPKDQKEPHSHSFKSKKSDWRTYGPLKIDWTKWQPLGGSYVTPTLNKDGKALYLAINCSAKKINATGANGTWKNWIEPIEQFEYDLIRDLCTQKKS